MEDRDRRSGPRRCDVAHTPPGRASARRCRRGATRASSAGGVRPRSSDPDRADRSGRSAGRLPGSPRSSGRNPGREPEPPLPRAAAVRAPVESKRGDVSRSYPELNPKRPVTLSTSPASDPRSLPVLATRLAGFVPEGRCRCRGAPFGFDRGWKRGIALQHFASGIQGKRSSGAAAVRARARGAGEALRQTCEDWQRATGGILESPGAFGMALVARPLARYVERSREGRP